MEKVAWSTTRRNNVCLRQKPGYRGNRLLYRWRCIRWDMLEELFWSSRHRVEVLVECHFRDFSTPRRRRRRTGILEVLMTAHMEPRCTRVRAPQVVLSSKVQRLEFVRASRHPDDNVFKSEVGTAAFRSEQKLRGARRFMKKVFFCTLSDTDPVP